MVAINHRISMTYGVYASALDVASRVRAEPRPYHVVAPAACTMAAPGGPGSAPMAAVRSCSSICVYTPMVSLMSEWCASAWAILGVILARSMLIMNKCLVLIDDEAIRRGRACGEGAVGARDVGVGRVRQRGYSDGLPETELAVLEGMPPLPPVFEDGSVEAQPYIRASIALGF
jgi:hypothetical protein